MSFCGSTQLARLIDESGAGIVLKEPYALVDLVDWHWTLREHRSENPSLTVTLRAKLTLLSRRWAGAAPTVIKPSNWANLPLLAVMPTAPDDRILLVTIDRRSILLAAFRGDRDRLTFPSRAASHFAIALGHIRTVYNAIASAPQLALATACEQLAAKQAGRRSALRGRMRKTGSSNRVTGRGSTKLSNGQLRF